MNREDLLAKAQAGDIKAFHKLFAEFQPHLKSYLYRLTANRNDMEDLAQDVFILAFDGITEFKGNSSLKTWVFTLATNHALRQLKRRRRWFDDTQQRVRKTAHTNPHLLNAIDHTNATHPLGVYEIKEHIDFCFTCTTKMLPLAQQVALLLKDIYNFKIDEISDIMDQSRGSVKHLIHNARKTMIEVFDDQCALVSKKGACNQCSQLNGRFNPKQNTQAKLIDIEMIRHKKEPGSTLYRLRTELARNINPLTSSGANLHEVFFSIAHQANASELRTTSTKTASR